MAFPSTFSAFNRPQPTDRLNSPSHSALHNTVSSAVGQLEAVIGLTGASSVLGTIEGDLRSPSSGGGGHIQTAVFGGTGQTSFNKGDLLVGQSNSVLTKVAIGTDLQILTADSNQATGVKWATSPTGSRVNTNASTITVASTVSQTAFAGASILASVIGINGGVRFTVPITFHQGQTGTTAMSLYYGANQVASFNLTKPGNNTDATGIVDGLLIGAGSSSTQSGYIRATLPGNPSMLGFATGTSSTDANSLQQMQVRVTNGDTNCRLDATFSEFDKII